MCLMYLCTVTVPVRHLTTTKSLSWGKALSLSSITFTCTVMTLSVCLKPGEDRRFHLFATTLVVKMFHTTDVVQMKAF